MGTILGGSSIVKPPKGKNCYLFMRSCNKTWLSYKAAELKDFASQNPFTKETNTNRWHSSCWPMFNDYRQMFYKNDRKVITAEIMQPLRDIGLAVWFGDNGKIDKNGSVILNTHNFGMKSSKAVVSYLKSCDIESKVWLQDGRYRVRITLEGSIRFLKTIAHRLPIFMHHKLLANP